MAVLDSSDLTTVSTPHGPVRVRDTGGSGTPVLLVHGLLVDPDLYDALTPLLTARGHRCVIPELPLGGHLLPMDDDADLSRGPRRPARRDAHRDGRRPRARPRSRHGRGADAAAHGPPPGSGRPGRAHRLRRVRRVPAQELRVRGQDPALAGRARAAGAGNARPTAAAPRHPDDGVAPRCRRRRARALRRTAATGRDPARPAEGAEGHAPAGHPRRGGDEQDLPGSGARGVGRRRPRLPQAAGLPARAGPAARAPHRDPRLRGVLLLDQPEILADLVDEHLRTPVDRARHGGAPASS